MTLLLDMLAILTWTLPVLVIVIALLVVHKKNGDNSRSEATMIILCTIYYCALSLYTMGNPIDQMTETFYRSFHSLVFILFARSLYDKLHYINKQRVNHATNPMVHNNILSKAANSGGDRKSSASHS